jgi:predicted transporter
LLLNGGLLVATIVLSIKTGFVLASSRLNGARIAITAFGFGGALLALTIIFKEQQLLLAEILDRYTFSGAIAVSLALIYLGSQDSSAETGSCNRNRAVFKDYLGFLPCPFCTIALAFSVLAIAPVMGMSVIRAGSYSAIAFSVFTTVAALTARKLIGVFKWQPAALFDQLLFFSGVLTLTFALTIPNFVQAMTTPPSPITIDSPALLVLVMALFFALALLGFVNNQARYLKGRDRR